MFFSKVKQCKDIRAIKAGLKTLSDYKKLGVDVKAFGCCFVEDTFAFSFKYNSPCHKNLQNTMAVEVMKLLPKEKQYSSVLYYLSDKFENECCKRCKDKVFWYEPESKE